MTPVFKYAYKELKNAIEYRILFLSSPFWYVGNIFLLYFFSFKMGLIQGFPNFSESWLFLLYHIGYGQVL